MFLREAGAAAALTCLFAPEKSAPMLSVVTNIYYIFVCILYRPISCANTTEFETSYIVSCCTSCPIFNRQCVIFYIRLKSLLVRRTLSHSFYLFDYSVCAFNFFHLLCTPWSKKSTPFFIIAITLSTLNRFSEFFWQTHTTRNLQQEDNNLMSFTVIEDLLLHNHSQVLRIAWNRRLHQRVICYHNNNLLTTTRPTVTCKYAIIIGYDSLKIFLWNFDKNWQLLPK